VGSIVIFAITKDIDFVLAVLLVVCADDIAVSIPLAFTVAVSTAAKNGILIKSSDVLERLPKIDTFITDKTGTLTSAKPKIVKIETFGRHTQKDVLHSLVAAEVNSSHPIARPIVEYAKRQNISAPAITEFKETPGDGIEIKHQKRNIIAGKYDFLKDRGVKIGEVEKQTIHQYLHDGYSIVALGIDKKLSAIVVFEDELKPSTRGVIKATKAIGVKNWIMLTGDNEIVAKKVAHYTGIDSYRSQLMPNEKLEFVEKYKKENKDKSIAMIGDGVNDAAALALADTSFAMGVVGSDAAINAADVALMNDNLEKIPEAMELGRVTRRVSFANFGIWGITNIVGLVLVFTHVLKPTGAAAYNFLTDFLPIFNAFGVALFKKDPEVI
jgi:Cd2+/Zn2+-exporting ATPase